ncbi:hypothetical protein VTO42DRAFT_2802 [Malbranchea cinnamomea]
MMPSRNTFSPPPSNVTPPPRPVFRPSASPAISSIIDPPTRTETSNSTSLPAQNQHQNHKSTPGSLATSPKPAFTEPAAISTTQNLRHDQSEKRQQQQHQQPQAQPDKPVQDQPATTTTTTTATTAATAATATVKDNTGNKSPPQQKPPVGSTGPSSAGAPSPKPARSKEKEAPPRATGSGLLSSALFGGIDAMNSSTSNSAPRAPDIILHIPLKGQSNKVINFARMAEEKYGFDALNPRVAAQKARRAQIEAASAALEKSQKNGTGESGAEEDLSLDVERESDADGDVVMGGTTSGTDGVNGSAAASTEDNAGAKPKKRARRKKIEDYDRDDPFVDDSELIWQEQAAACKDGFFVYFGPLVPEGEKVTIERADGTIKRGRGRGRGASSATHTHSTHTSGDKPAGGRGRGGAPGHHSRDKDHAGIGNHPDAHNLAAAAGEGGSAGTGSGRGRGGRGSGTTRKPRMTKADRAQMEKEKADREKAGLALAASKQQQPQSHLQQEAQVPLQVQNNGDGPTSA